MNDRIKFVCPLHPYDQFMIALSAAATEVGITGEEHSAFVFDIRLYLTPLGQARQFIETCGT